jgi:hypothetical protein
MAKKLAKFNEDVSRKEILRKLKEADRLFQQSTTSAASNELAKSNKKQKFRKGLYYGCAAVATVSAALILGDLPNMKTLNPELVAGIGVMMAATAAGLILEKADKDDAAEHGFDI